MAYDGSTSQRQEGKKKVELKQEEKDLLKKIVDHYADEDRSVRTAKLRHYRRLKLYWNSISNIYWSDVARDFRIYGRDEYSYADSDQSYYDRPVNVYRALLETIIAALAIQIPTPTCSPDDADNPQDQATAKAGDKIVELLSKHNDHMFIWLRALYLWVTEGMVACYNYEKTDKSYGEYDVKQYKDEKVDAYVCPNCKKQIEDSVIESYQAQDPAIAEEAVDSFEAEAEENKEIELDEYSPDDDDAELHTDLKSNKLVCPECMAELDPELKKSKLVIPRFVGMTKAPKSRICFDLFGELYIKISNSARTQADTPYLIQDYETDYANVLERYRDNEELWNKLPKGSNTPNSRDPYEAYSRVNPQYRSSFPENQTSVRNAWLRPSAFNAEVTQEESESLHEKWPDGCKVVIVEDMVVDVCNENLDDCWTLTRNPLADFMSNDPVGELIVNIQDIVNDLIALTLQTIEQGIPQTWVDPAVVDVPAYGQLEASPGTITPTKTQGGTRNIGEAFYQSKASSLSPEVFQFYGIIQQLGQFVSAAMPSIFGGSQEAGSSRTASEYAMSRTASLQRLQTPWRMFSVWWKTIFGKAVPAYMKLVHEDEKFTKKDTSGRYVNVWIRKADLTGKIGEIELENSDNMPVTDDQKAEWIMKLMELNNQEIQAALLSLENLPFVRKVVKIPEFKIPGEDDRQKQNEEIQQLLAEEPIVIPPDDLQIQLSLQATGMPPQEMEEPSVAIDELVDNHPIHIATIRSWAVSEAGRLAKLENLPGYTNCLLHMKQHMDAQAQIDMALQQQAAALNQDKDNKTKGNTPPENKNDSGFTGEEISEGDNVRTPIQ